MNTCHYKRLTSSILIGLFILLINQQQVQGQQEKPLSYDDVILLLNFTSRINKSTEKTNKQLIKDVREKGVEFTLSSTMEESLKRAGGNDLLIKTIREEVPKNLTEKRLLYQKFIDNYNGTFEQKKIALETAKEFVKKFGNDPSKEEDIKNVIKYFREYIPASEKDILRNTNCNCNCKCQ